MVSHSLSLFSPLSLFILFLNFCLIPISLVFVLFFVSLYFLFNFASYRCLYLSPLNVCFFLTLSLSSCQYFFFSYIIFSLFCHFKLLVQFSPRAVVWLKAAKRHQDPVQAHQAVDAGSSHRSHTPHGLGWDIRLHTLLKCTLCLVRLLRVLAD